MAKQPKRPTRKQKIEAAKLAKIEETKALKKQVALLDDRVSKLENPQTVAEGRPGRNFIGKKETE